MINSASWLVCTRPSHLKIEVTAGITLPQAASRFSTIALAIRIASLRFAVVTNTTTTLRDDALIDSYTSPFLSKDHAPPRHKKVTQSRKTMTYG
jgi:hypothetical protein